MTQLFQTIGAPPRIGSTILATIGSAANERNALRKRVEANNATNPVARAGPAMVQASAREYGVGRERVLEGELPLQPEICRVHLVTGPGRFLYG